METKNEIKQPRLILSEEEYTATLSQIVQRDFFPELPELERQVAVLDRRSNGDVAGAVAVRRAARKLAQHEQALVQYEDEEENDLRNDSKTRKRRRPLHRETVTGFHARVTNEDDDEFDRNQKEQVKENRERLEALFRPQKPQQQQLLRLSSSESTHESLLASDDFEPPSHRISSTAWNQPTVRNGLFFVPTPQWGPNHGNLERGQTMGLIEGEQTGSSSALSLQQFAMPPPTNRERTSSTALAFTTTAAQQLASIPPSALVEYIPKHSMEKKIVPSCTRFPKPIIPFQPAAAAAAAAATTTSITATGLSYEGTTDGSITDASTDLDAIPMPLEQEKKAYEQARRKEQEEFVAMTPLLVPGGAAGNESPIVTWGTIDSTPLVLSGASDDPDEKIDQMVSTFSVAEQSDREVAALKAQDELERRAKRAKSGKDRKSKRASHNRRPTLNGRRHTDSLTPAAQSLFEKTNASSMSKRRDTFASSLRQSYTPQRQRTSSSSSSSLHRNRDHAFKATPLQTRHYQSTEPSQKKR